MPPNIQLELDKNILQSKTEAVGRKSAGLQGLKWITVHEI